ncbi:MAG TPA: hypothetical protein VKQ52_04995, partial [Puia sp.]|nr:hypothetical protein [Puia sp.]
MRTLAIISILLIPAMGLCQETPAKPTPQKDIIDVGRSVLKIHPRVRQNSRKSIYFSILPTSSQAAGPAGLSITATTAAFNLGDDGTGFLSTVTFAPYVATHGRIGFALRSNLWLPHNTWDILGDSRLLYYPQETWGLG